MTASTGRTNPNRPEPTAAAPAVFVHGAILTKLLYEIPEVMELLSMSRTTIYEQMTAGRLRSVHEGRARRIPASAMLDYVALLETEAAHTATGDASPTAPRDASRRAGPTRRLTGVTETVTQRRAA